MTDAAPLGCIGLAASADGAAIVEIRVQRNTIHAPEELRTAIWDAGRVVAHLALAAPPGSHTSTPEVFAALAELERRTGCVATIVRAEQFIARPETRFGTYLHHDQRFGVVVQAEGPVPDDTLKDIAVHIAAVVPRPQGINPDQITDAMIERERARSIEQTMRRGRSQASAEAAANRNLARLKLELALTEQSFVKDPAKKVKDLLPGRATIVAFRRWELGGSAVDGN